jgi:hypothetical protein
VSDRLVANAEELTLHVMSSEVTLIMAKMANDGRPAPRKVTASIENSLDYLDANMTALFAALPEGRTLSFLEVTLFCVMTHLPFREVMDVSRWSRLGDFCRRFGQRESARATEYRFDKP